MNNENFTTEQLNKFGEIAKKIEEAFVTQGLQTQILVGSTDLVNWNEIVTPDFVVFGVLNVAGGNTEISNGATIKNTYLNLALALPNETSSDYSNALVSVETAITSLQEASLSNNFTIENQPSYLADNGRTPANFMVIRGGKHIGVIIQSLVLTSAENLLLSSDATITIQPSSASTGSEMKGLYNYDFSKTKIIDSSIPQGQLKQKNFVQSIQYTVVLQFNKIDNNTLHQALLSDSDYFTITINDGQDNILTNESMILQKYTQRGTFGGFINCEAIFVTKG